MKMEDGERMTEGGKERRKDDRVKKRKRMKERS